jgi:hypothetical protein
VVEAACDGFDLDSAGLGVDGVIVRKGALRQDGQGDKEEQEAPEGGLQFLVSFQDLAFSPGVFIGTMCESSPVLAAMLCQA